MNKRDEQYRRALRWYPPQWRREHGPALVGDLMEQDDARGRVTPSPSDRLAIASQGIQARFLAPAVAGRFQLIALVVAVAFMAFYEAAIARANGGTPPGGIGPFTNWLIVPAISLLAALILALVKLARTARLFAWLALLCTLVVAILGALFHWQGPSSITAVLIVLLSLAAAAPVMRRGAAAAAVVLGVVLFAVLFVLEPLVNNLSPEAYVRNPLAALGLLALGLLGVVLIAAAAWRLSPTAH